MMASATKPTSMLVFRKYIRQIPSPNSPLGFELDASQIVSRECYDEWCEGRGYSGPEQTAKTFQRALTGHISGTDGRLPFTPEEEAAVLKVVRLKRIWPCFIETAPTVQIGAKGFRARGFHERQEDSAGGVSVDALQPGDVAPAESDSGAEKKKKKRKQPNEPGSNSSSSKRRKNGNGADEALLNSLQQTGGLSGWLPMAGTHFLPPTWLTMPSPNMNATATLSFSPSLSPFSSPYLQTRQLDSSYDASSVLSGLPSGMLTGTDRLPRLGQVIGNFTPSMPTSQLPLVPTQGLPPSQYMPQPPQINDSADMSAVAIALTSMER